MAVFPGTEESPRDRHRSAFIDFATMPQFSLEMFRSYFDQEIERVRALGHDVRSCRWQS